MLQASSRRTFNQAKELHRSEDDLLQQTECSQTSGTRQLDRLRWLRRWRTHAGLWGSRQGRVLLIHNLQAQEGACLHMHTMLHSLITASCM